MKKTALLVFGILVFVLSAPAVEAGYRRIIREVGGAPSSGSVELDTPQNTSPETVFKIISRFEWGADESLRWATNFSSQKQSKSQLESDPDVARIIYGEGGHELWWPIEIADSVQKLVIHHTDTDDLSRSSDEIVRAIYKYHAEERDWGDIGYNYIIGQDGKIFEGRAGGDGVVGAHASGFNVGTVGIAVIGDYHDTLPSAAALSSLHKLVDYLAAKHDIDEKGQSEWRGILMPNILGHRDLNNTNCPGDELYDEIVELRGGLVYTPPWRVPAVDETIPDLVDDDEEEVSIIIPATPVFDFEVVSGEGARGGAVGDTLTFNLVVKNTGNMTWTQDDLFLKSVASWKDPLLQIQSPQNRQGKVADMAQKTVAPGATAVFRFTVDLQQPGATRLNVFPVWRGQSLTEPVLIPVEIAP